MIKKKSLALGLLLIIFTFTSASVFSQQMEKVKKTPEERAAKMSERMKKNLSLTDEQYKQVYNLFLSKAQDMKNNKEKLMGMDKEARKQMKMNSREEFKKQLSGILNPDQMKKFEENKKKHKEGKIKKNKQKKDKSKY
ncbi:MAG TPA: hypothetical protein PKC91_05520 [Ignavibacteria bacterium]|nr:hypothetical protein [Ignavibacteria bacterium]